MTARIITACSSKVTAAACQPRIVIGLTGIGGIVLVGMIARLAEVAT